MIDLEAIELIKQLKARYFRFLDTANWEGMQRSVFTADATINFKSPSYDISFKGWGDIENFYKSAFTKTRFGMHNGHHPEITVSGDTAVGLWYLHDIFVNLDDNTQFEGSALYRDEYVKKDGEWRIQNSAYERLFEQISKRPDDVKVTAIPIGNRFACD
ncbi:nuclear transport factor 2 family protein [Litorivivens sp.]|uniref:nuclear transport factor 2 family protein n=1 Tax=Litorivivens sp. TaxID=2020868 RepID=UPI0035672470